VSTTRIQIVERFLTDEKVLEYDPYADECDVKYQSVKIITTRKEQKCSGVPGLELSDHVMPAGTRARFERAMVDGEWAKYYSCIEFIKKGLVDFPEYFQDLDDEIRRSEEVPHA
jgi:hypothetical protein